MLKATNGDNVDVMMVMLTETLRREFPNVTPGEIDKIEQEDFVNLIDLTSKANKGLDKIAKNAKEDEDQETGETPTEDFTTPAN